MSYIRCVYKLSKETVLWENPQPTNAFATQTVTLSDDITNYDMLRIEGIATTTNDTYLEVYVDPLYLVTCSTSKSEKAGGCGIAASTGAGSTGSRYTRVLKSTTSAPNKIEFGSEFSMATSTSKNENAIPTRIIGIKYAKGD